MMNFHLKMNKNRQKKAKTSWIYLEKIKLFDTINLKEEDMKIDILERGGYKATKRIKTIIEDKLAKLDKYFAKLSKALY